MKATWSKVYCGPGYPIDPAKESERNSVPMQDFIPLHPKDVMKKFLNAITEGLIQPQKAKLVNGGAGISVLSPVDPTYSCVMKPLSKKQKAEFNHSSDLFYDFIDEINKHAFRTVMLETKDFQSRLMAIEVKERSR